MLAFETQPFYAQASLAASTKSKLLDGAGKVREVRSKHVQCDEPSSVKAASLRRVPCWFDFMVGLGQKFRATVVCAIHQNGSELHQVLRKVALTPLGSTRTDIPAPPASHGTPDTQSFFGSPRLSGITRGREGRVMASSSSRPSSSASVSSPSSSTSSATLRFSASARLAMRVVAS